MRRLKRDPLERAYKRGFLDGIAGKSKELCPYEGEKQFNWNNGWREGFDARCAGETGIAGIHRLSENHAFG
jgi:ribosome modulation factor